MSHTTSVPSVYRNCLITNDQVTWADALNEPLPDLDSDLALALQLSREVTHFTFLPDVFSLNQFLRARYKFKLKILMSE